MNSLGVGKSLASLGVVGKSPSSVDLGWGWRGGWVSRTFKRSRSAYRPKHPVIQVMFSKIKALESSIFGEHALHGPQTLTILLLLLVTILDMKCKM